MSNIGRRFLVLCVGLLLFPSFCMATAEPAAGGASAAYASPLDRPLDGATATPMYAREASPEQQSASVAAMLRPSLGDPVRESQKYREVEVNIQAAQAESKRFRKLGVNWASDWLAVSLACATLVTAIGAAVQGSGVWARRVALRHRVLLGLAIAGACTSAASLYLKQKDDQFTKENHDKYISLSLDMDEVIARFWLEHGAEHYTPESIKDPKKLDALWALHTRTQLQLRALARDYRSRYGINTNPVSED